MKLMLFNTRDENEMFIREMRAEIKVNLWQLIRAVLGKNVRLKEGSMTITQHLSEEWLEKFYEQFGEEEE